ncbi:hypothetical protein LCGC14_2309730 [marine sediment metagenome]|uniref:Uncharacterized protein n=1 Tax=marine sediment metagenome TaxID=412755 RepID=A0A0F9EYD4_9ZZZZ
MATKLRITTDERHVWIELLDQEKPYRWKDFVKIVEQGKVKIGDLVDRTGNGDLWRVTWIKEIPPE